VTNNDGATHWIAGRAVSSSGGPTLTVVDPATELRVGTLPVAGTDEVSAAVDAARAAGPAWAAMKPSERLELLRSVAARFAAAVDELADLESREMGKPLAMARDDIAMSAEGFPGAAEAAIDFFAVDDASAGRLVRHPYGVAALITPWNYPVCQVIDPLGALLAAGNTVVVKPSEKASLSVAALGPLLADLPPGVVNIVLGDGSTGAAVVEHEGVDLVHFTGSVATGRRVAGTAGQRLIPAFLELGGQDALVIDEGVDATWAAEVAAEGGFANTGQVCVSVERVYVHRTVAEPFIAALTEQATQWTVGAGTDPQVRMGPLVDARQRDLVHAQVQQAVAQGGRLVLGGELPSGPGFFYPPTIVVDPPHDSALMTDETFGPVIAVCVVDSFAEGIERANATEYGLTASALTANPDHIALAAQLRAGAVTVNGGGDGPDDAPFEPARASGAGRLHFGRRALESYTRPQALSVGSAR